MVKYLNLNGLAAHNSVKFLLHAISVSKKHDLSCLSEPSIETTIEKTIN